ncbi:MAG TPA: hypothetical protein VFV33_16200 [Gemmatimonadaceae bacterium]|nr:hypothetical protein [Gemmatimonadaceae bacterium]
MPVRALLIRFSLGATLVAAAPIALAAQSSDPAPRAALAPTLLADSVPAVAAPATHVPAGPRTGATIAGIDVRSADAALPAPVVASPRTTRGQALAIVGGAAFIGGLIIGDSAGTGIAVGGLGVGIYGLWLWLGGR